MSGCCQRKLRAEMDALDHKGFVDPVRVERAMSGDPGTKLNRAEANSLVIRLAQERRMGLAQIQQHCGYSRSQIAAILAAQRKAKGTR